jgi:hypothetical protein
MGFWSGVIVSVLTSLGNVSNVGDSSTNATGLTKKWVD